jgi:hypothetical protein
MVEDPRTGESPVTADEKHVHDDPVSLLLLEQAQGTTLTELHAIALRESPSLCDSGGLVLGVELDDYARLRIYHSVTGHHAQ